MKTARLNSDQEEIPLITVLDKLNEGRSADVLYDCHFSRFRAFASSAYYVLDSLSFAQSLNITLNVVSMNEKIFITTVRSNETKTFLCVEKLNDTCMFCHVCILIC